MTTAARIRYQCFIADSARWDGFAHRSDDIVISTPPKCGTTWLQTLVGLLIFHGDLPASLSELSPWVDMRIRTRAQLDDLVSAQRHRRFLKTHVPLDGLPLDDGVTHIVVARDPRDAWLSLVDHVHNVDGQRVMRLIGDLPVAGGDDGPDPVADPPAAFGHDLEQPCGHDQSSGRPADVLHHLHTAWERREHHNVALFHYADLLRDLPREVTRLAELLGVAVTDADVERTCARAGLDTLRADPRTYAPDAGLGVWRDDAAFFHKGRIGEWRTAFPPDLQSRYVDRVTALHPDEDDFLAWAHGTEIWQS